MQDLVQSLWHSHMAQTPLGLSDHPFDGVDETAYVQMKFYSVKT
jgi:hypothetical protein